ncbi:flavonoid 3',5'-hydroxylase 2-like [Syzygium oleosum]|uniref:flavonoid 3',5'-hydroxylase 2-like n=1 Tax=Syzygium oleosum TaxID=219896 RepID=UPI0011D1A49A|nr:flavonoid 3',5'-hydroxylase 2-like [Syzygium oleosum]
MIILRDEILLWEIASAALLFLITCFFFRSLLLRLNPRQVPPGPKGWPVVGVLPLMGNMPHATLAKMAKKYGPMMYLKMGSRDMVVASTPDAARAFLKTLDLNFSNRPLDLGAVQMTYNGQDMVFTDYGPRWKLLRKLSNFHMLGWKALEDWANAWSAELQYTVRFMCECGERGEPVVVLEMLTYAMSNMMGQVVVSRTVFEKKGFESKEFRDMVVEFMGSAGYFNIGDFIPSVACMDLQGIEGRMKRLHQKFDALLTKMIEQHSVSAHERKGKPDFLDVLLANRENSEGEKLSLINTKALLLAYACVTGRSI